MKTLFGSSFLVTSIKHRNSSLGLNNRTTNTLPHRNFRRIIFRTIHLHRFKIRGGVRRKLCASSAKWDHAWADSIFFIPNPHRECFHQRSGAAQHLCSIEIRLWSKLAENLKNSKNIKIRGFSIGDSGPPLVALVIDSSHH